MPARPIRAMALLLAAAVAPRVAAPQQGPAPLKNLRYEVTFDSATASRSTIKVALSFDVAGPGPVELSFPVWTPGAYEVSNFARRVIGFTPTADGRPLSWDKFDYDTWRVQPGTARSITVRYDYLADTLDNAMSWARPDFVLFNGTNLLPYPEGRDFNFPASVTVKTQPGWLVATGMKRGPAAGSYQEGELPRPGGQAVLHRPHGPRQRPDRQALAPPGELPGGHLHWAREVGSVGSDREVHPDPSRSVRETPWDTYTYLMIFTPEAGGGSALEHSNSHVGIYNPGFIGNPLLASITAHEVFHSWNVKRLRPADMWPYHYDREQETTWLWESEGITDYYADLALVRGGIIDSAQFMGLTNGKVDEVAESPPTALEDASLSTWIGPTDGTQYLYYPKGSLVGLLLDILIRDASDNKRSLDNVLREIYRATYKKGRGYTAQDWWSAVSKAAGGRSFAEFNTKYIDGREPLPYEQVFPLAGMRLKTDTLREPRLGLATGQDSSGAIVVHEVVPGSPAAAAGVQVGDALLALGDVEVDNPDFGKSYRARFGRSEGDSLPIKVRRGTDTLTLAGKVVLGARLERRLEAAPDASPKAVRIRNGILRGKTD